MSIYVFTLTDAGGRGIPNQTVDVSSLNNNELTSNSLITDFKGQAQVSYRAINGGTDMLSSQALGAVAKLNVTISLDDFSIVSPSDGAEIALDSLQNVCVRWLQNSVPVAGQAVAFSTTRGAVTPSLVVTNASGAATVCIRSQHSGFAIISATATNGPTTTRKLEFIATVPATIEVRAEPSTIHPGNEGNITAVVRDRNGNLVKKKRVSFSLTDITAGTLSSSSAITDSQGRAQVSYQAGDSTSANEGVYVAASIQDFPAITERILLH